MDLHDPLDDSVHPPVLAVEAADARIRLEEETLPPAGVVQGQAVVDLLLVAVLDGDVAELELDVPGTLGPHLGHKPVAGLDAIGLGHHPERAQAGRVVD